MCTPWATQRCTNDKKALMRRIEARDAHRETRGILVKITLVYPKIYKNNLHLAWFLIKYPDETFVRFLIAKLTPLVVANNLGSSDLV